ncbi:unnamed protein product, partial [Didymodactylos carnosus]
MSCSWQPMGSPIEIVGSR